MTELREAVTISTATDKMLHGYLYLGLNGLPELCIPTGWRLPNEMHTVASFPAAWTLSSPTCGPLYTAWQEIEAIRERLRYESDLRAYLESLAGQPPTLAEDVDSTTSLPCPDCGFFLLCPCIDALPGPDLPDDDVTAYKRDADVRGER